MKKTNLAAMVAAAAVAAIAFVFTSCGSSGNHEAANAAESDSLKVVPGVAVDLGLPSGTLWADRNVGATENIDYGWYFAWGETVPKRGYDWCSYNYSESCSWHGITKYQVEDEQNDCIWYKKTENYVNESNKIYRFIGDRKSTLELSDDAANANWGGPWHMPTIKQFEELQEKCKWTWTSNYYGKGVAGCYVEGPNGNSIFLPAAGRRWDSDILDEGCNGSYWSAEIGNYGTKNACYECIHSGGSYDKQHSERFIGFSVRPVCSSAEYSSGKGNSGDSDANVRGKDDAGGSEEQVDSLKAGAGESIDLGLTSGTLWADRNVGASEDIDYGWYLAWGETEPKEVFEWSTYKYVSDVDWHSITKYQVNDCEYKACWYEATPGKYDLFGNQYKFIGDDKAMLELSDDAARVNWGGRWRMPTTEQFYELSDECTWTWISHYNDKGVAGFKVEGPNGNSIFLPAAGHRRGPNLYAVGKTCDYWSAELDTHERSDYACFGVFFEGYDGDDSDGGVGDNDRNDDSDGDDYRDQVFAPYVIDSGYRCEGNAVRPVISPSK